MPWLDFVADGLRPLRGRELSQEVDRALGLLMLLKRPVMRESALRELAESTGMPLATLRDQLASLPARRRPRRPSGEAGGPVGESGGVSEVPRGVSREAADSMGDSRAEPNLVVDPRVIRAYEEVVGAALVDPSLCPRIRSQIERCPVPELGRILAALLVLWDDDDMEVDDGESDGLAQIDEAAVMAVLGADHARDFVLGLAEYARLADDPGRLMEGALEFLSNHDRAVQRSRLVRQFQDLSAPDGGLDSNASRVSDSGVGSGVPAANSAGSSAGRQSAGQAKDQSRGDRSLDRQRAQDEALDHLHQFVQTELQSLPTRNEL